MSARIDQPRGRLVGYVWWCGDDYCDCHQAVIEWEGWHCERVWAGKFRTDGGWAECNRDLNRTAQWMRRHHHDLYQAIRWPWVTA